MPARTWLRSCSASALLSLALLFTPVDARAQDLSPIRAVDALNLFPNVGALIYFAEPNDFGIPPGIVTQCSGTLIHERAFLVAGHCTAATGGTLLPFIKAFVTLSPNALDQSAWREVSGLAYHPSIPLCPPPDFCTFHGLDPGILDVGLVFLRQLVRHIEPATLARPGALESDRAAGQFMIVAGYGFSGLSSGRDPSTDFRLGWASAPQDFQAAAGRRQRVGELVSPRHRLLRGFRSANVLQRPSIREPIARARGRRGKRWRRRVLLTR